MKPMRKDQMAGQECYDLMPAQLQIQIPGDHVTAGQSDPVLWVKWFTPDSSWTWYVAEFDGEDICFGLVDGFEREWGDFSLAEIQAIRGPLGLPVERDLYFTPAPASQVCPTS